MRVLLRPAAARDIVSAARWYETDRPGRGGRFLAAVRAVLSLLSSHPEAFPIAHVDVRRALLGRFPYALYYRVHHAVWVEVIACLHTRRGPDDPDHA